MSTWDMTNLTLVPSEEAKVCLQCTAKECSGSCKKVIAEKQALKRKKLMKGEQSKHGSK